MVGDFYNAGSKTDIDGIQEIAGHVFLAVIVITCADIYFTATVIYDTIYGFLVFRTHFPIFGKVIADAIGDNADSDVLFIFRVGKHYAVDCIVQCTVTSYNDNGAVTVVGKYACQTFYGAEPFGLHIIVRHAFAVHICFNLFPPFLHFARSGFGVIDYAPFIGFYTHISVSFNRSNIFINLPLKRCCRQRY